MLRSSLVLVSCLTVTSLCAADETETTAACQGLSSAVPIGAAVVDITPDYPVRLTGYGNRMKESEGVAAKIHARALVIGSSATGDLAAEQRQPIAPGASPGDDAPKDEKAPEGRHNDASEKQSAAPSGLKDSLSNETPGSRPGLSTAVAPRLNGYAILITVDNCGVPLEMTEAVYERIAAKYRIPRQNFAISSTHSHSAPWLRGFAPNIFAEIPDDHAAHLAQYEKELTDKLVDVVEKAIASQRPGHLSYGFGEAGFAMNRRALANGKWSGFGEVPDGPTDKRVPVLAAHDVEGKLIAVLANYACHCTTETGEFNQISGDWAGFAADMLETDHPGAMALIAIGCGADANPSPRGTHEQAKVHGKTIADEVTRILASGRASALRDHAQPSPLPRAGGEGQGEGAASDLQPASSTSSPLIWPSATFSPDLGGEGTLRIINPSILCNMARIDLPLGPIPSRETWEQQAKEAGVTGSRARYFLQMLDEGKPIPTTIPNYPVQTWCFGDDLAMVFLGGEVVVDYSIRMNDMFDSDRLWINAYSNDVPCYIASARVLREGGYECDSSMLYYRRPTRLAPEAEDVLCDAVQKIMPHKFYSEKLQQDFPAPKSPEESLKTMTTKPDLRVVLAASEPLIRDPVAFDWDERGRLWVVEMGDYPKGDSKVAVSLRRDEPSMAQQSSGTPVASTKDSPTDNAVSANEANSARLISAERDGYRGRVQMLEDTDKNGVYDKATTFLDNLAFPNGIHCWRGGVIITMAPEIFYAEDTDGDGKADVRETMYRGFVEGNQQHRINGLRWGLDGWLYLANGDSGGEIAGAGFVPGSTSGEPGGVSPRTAEQNKESQSPGADASRLTEKLSLRGRDLRVNPDTNELDAVSGQTQFGRERDDFGNWFGNNNSNPIWQYVLEDRYVRRNPHAGISQVTAPVAVIPGAAPVYPTSRTLARFNDFAFANRFTSACSTMIYRDNYLGEQYYGNAFTSEPVHNLVSRLVMTRDGYGFKGERAADEQQSEFLSSSDNWFRPTMIRTGPDGAIWVADMYRAVIEHPEWIPPEYQRKMNLYAGSDMGRIYRIVPASECCGDSASGAASAPRENGDATQQQNALGGLTPSARQNAHGGLTPNRSPAREDGYFDQPWNEIPIEALIKRLESPNGWWRDIAQRILTHRRKELYEKDWLPKDWEKALPAARVQIAATLAAINRFAAAESHYLSEAFGNLRTRALLVDEDPRVRQAALAHQMFPFAAAAHSESEILKRLADDPDKGVQLQLAFSLGDVGRKDGDRLLGRLLRDNFGDLYIRNAALSSLYSTPALGSTITNLDGVIAEAIDVSRGPINDELVAILLEQAAALGRSEAITEPLKTLLKSIDSSAPTGRLEVIANLLDRTLRGPTLDAMKRTPNFEQAIQVVREAAEQIARDEATDSDRRAAALRLAMKSGQLMGAQPIELSEFLTPQAPLALQLAVVELIAADGDPRGLSQLSFRWKSLAPNVRAVGIAKLMQRESSVEWILERMEANDFSSVDIDSVQRDQLIHHRNETVAARAKKLFDVMANTARSTVVEDFKSQISSLKFEISKDEQAAAGKLVFEKRCATCHRLQDTGKEVGADLAALKDRSTEALLTAILDPNKAVESKFLVYTVVTKDGLQHSGMLKGETGGSLTLIGNDGKEITVVRADIEELVGSQRSLMPEGLEKDLSATDIANVIAFVQSTGTPWKRFDGNAPKFVAANADGTVTLPASEAEIYGPSLIFEEKYGNLGYWLSADDYARWTFEVPKSGHWTVEFDFACDDSNAGSLIKFSTGNRMLTARVPGSGTWDNYQTWQAGTIDLHRGRGQLIITAPEKPPFALIDLRAVRLIPPK